MEWRAREWSIKLGNWSCPWVPRSFQGSSPGGGGHWAPNLVAWRITCSFKLSLFRWEGQQQCPWKLFNSLLSNDFLSLSWAHSLPRDQLRRREFLASVSLTVVSPCSTLECRDNNSKEHRASVVLAVSTHASFEHLLKRGQCHPRRHLVKKKTIKQSTASPPMNVQFTG